MSKTKRKIKNLLINVFLISLVFLIITGFLELLFLIFPELVPDSIDYLARGGVHKYDSEMFAILRPDLNKDFYLKGLDKTITVKTVSHGLEGIGFRDNFDKLEARKRILVLGDSFTFGTGVNSEDTFVANLEDKLRENGFDVDVINAGVVGYSSKLELLHYKRFSRKLNPEIVIVALWENDFDDNYIYENSPFIKLRAWLGRKSMLYNLMSTVAEIRERGKDSSLKKQDKIYFEEESEEVKIGYKIERRDLVELNKLVKEDGGIMILLILPGTQNIHVSELYKENDSFILIDLSSETFKIPRLLHPIHRHYTEESSKAVADLIYTNMIENEDIVEVLKDG